MHALLAVNMQVDHFTGAWPVPGAPGILASVNQLLSAFPLCVASKKWHPTDHFCFAANHSGHQPGEKIKIDHAHWVLKPTHCVRATPGANFAEGLESWRFEVVFRTCMHPDFDDGGAFSDHNNENNTGLDAWLLGRGVHHLYITGLTLEGSVSETALNATHSIRHVYVVREAVAGFDDAEMQNAWKILEENGVKAVSLAQALAAVE